MEGTALVTFANDALSPNHIMVNNTQYGVTYNAIIINMQNFIIIRTPAILFV